MSYLFAFSRYQTKCVIEFLFRKLMTSWTLGFIFDHRLKQWPTGRKRGKDRNTKFEYLENEKSFLDEIKSIFHCFRGAIICEKTKINENSGHKLERKQVKLFSCYVSFSLYFKFWTGSCVRFMHRCWFWCSLSMKLTTQGTFKGAFKIHSEW